MHLAPLILRQLLVEHSFSQLYLLVVEVFEGLFLRCCVSSLLVLCFFMVSCLAGADSVSELDEITTSLSAHSARSYTRTIWVFLSTPAISAPVGKASL